MTFLAIILIIILFWLIFGDRIKAWLQRRMMQKMEDTIRRSMGIPTAKEQRQRQKEAARGPSQQPSGRGNSSRNRSSSQFHQYPDSIIPKEYAEDVEFTEFKSYSDSVEIKSDTHGNENIKVESQVSDAEFVEIKNSSR